MATLEPGASGEVIVSCLCDWPVGLMAKSRVDCGGVAWEMASGTESQGPAARDFIGFPPKMKHSPRLPKQRLVFP